jgi:hypothetical protein
MRLSTLVLQPKNHGSSVIARTVVSAQPGSQEEKVIPAASQIADWPEYQCKLIDWHLLDLGA